MDDDKEKMLNFVTDNPDPSAPGTFFGVVMPWTPTDEAFDAIIEAIEFRRKCQNQGFNNLIEWVNMSRKNLKIKLNQPSEVSDG
jgi:hypothetical protein